MEREQQRDAGACVRCGAAAPPSAAPGLAADIALLEGLVWRETDCNMAGTRPGVAVHAHAILRIVAALRAAEEAHQYTPDPQWPGSGCTVCGRQRLPSHAWTAPTDAARKEAE
jgi:hypothetical protein